MSLIQKHRRVRRREGIGVMSWIDGGPTRETAASHWNDPSSGLHNTNADEEKSLVLEGVAAGAD